ncbi:MAG TPA: aromatic ring-hydroxylating dioxygenase subunit alpha [Reyranella sp.]|nr:aromatic ring-hydroxylating dioxygenase subunit alpha [Reyranella sp.]
MLVTQQPVLRRFWYPVIPADRLADQPVPFTLLGTNLVLFRDGTGKATALIDRCCHRTAKLSKGWLEQGNIVCPYHGWTYDGAGKCVRVPQRPDYKAAAEPGKGIAVEAFRCAERYGVVWVALEEPLRDIPELPEYDDPAYRRVFEFYEPWEAPGLRIMENSFDNAHFSYVHKESFGIVEEPEPVQPRLEPHPAGFVMYADVPVKNPDIQKGNLGIASDRTVRHYEKTWWMPFSRKMKVTYPNGLVHIIMTLTAPIDDRRSQVIQFLLRTDSEAEAPAANLIKFDRQVTHEDMTILEACDWDVPLSMTGELHMPTDRPGLEMRRMLAKLLAEHGEAEIRRDGPVSKPPSTSLATAAE